MRTALRFLVAAAVLSALPAALRAAPVPECEQEVLILHDIARDFVPQLTPLAVVTSDGFSPKGYANPNLGWLRDRYPLQARTAAGALVLVTYPAWANEGGWPVTLEFTYPGMRPDPAAPDLKTIKVGNQVARMEVRPLPLILEGGNVIGTAEWLFVGEKILGENAKTEDQLLAPYRSGPNELEARRTVAGFKSNGWRTRSRDEVLAEFARAFELPVDHVVVMPWMPGERTGHVDLFMGLLDRSTVAVPTIPGDLVAGLGYEHERAYAAGIQRFLDERARQVTEATGGAVAVVRLPMLPPKNLTESKLSPLGWDAQFPTPVNWVFHGGRAYVPTFPAFMTDLPQAQRMQDEVAACLKKFGYQAEFLPLRDLLSHAGLIHCLTAKLTMPRK